MSDQQAEKKLNEIASELEERLKIPDFDVSKYDPKNELKNRFQRFFPVKEKKSTKC